MPSIFSIVCFHTRIFSRECRRDNNCSTQNTSQQGCATGGPRATTRPAKPFSVALANTLIFPIMHENPNTTVHVKKLNFLCGPARCLKLVVWPTEKKCCTPLHHRFQQLLRFFGLTPPSFVVHLWAAFGWA